MEVVPSQNVEMGDFCASLTRFLIWSSDLPMRNSFSFANLALRLRCSGVWAYIEEARISFNSYPKLAIRESARRNWGRRTIVVRFRGVVEFVCGYVRRS